MNDEHGLQPILEELIRAGKVPGLSAAVVRDDAVSWIGAAGLADLEQRRPATEATVYLWFSMTKIATATVVVQLAERGKLGLDEPAATYVPEFPHPGQGSPATIRQLLSHSAGLPNPIPVRWIHPAGAPAPDSHQFTLRLLEKHRRLKGVPGGQARYSNLGYVVLGEVVSAATGMSFEDYVRENLLAPLGMTETDFFYSDRLASEAATPYQLRRSPLTPLYRLMLPKGIVGARCRRFVAFNLFCVDGPGYGGLIGSLEDAGRFLALHTSHGAVADGKVLSAASVESMQTIAARGRKMDVALGWFRRHSDRKLRVPYLEHLGGGGGFFNMMRIFPSEGLGVVVMGNATAYDHQRIAEAALRLT